MIWSLLALSALGIWAIILLLPWRPWSTAESLSACDKNSLIDLSRLTVIIPARDEAEVIGETLKGLERQGNHLEILLIDDQSEDATRSVAESMAMEGLRIIDGQSLPEGWSGKLWALEQGRLHLDRELVLLLDADIYLKPGTLRVMLEKFDHEELDLLSLMACLKMETFWEKLLMPAFIFFFKLLYPFSLANSPSSRVAAAAGGVILTRRRLLEDLGAFSCLRGALIDDCTLAGKIKKHGGKIWLGLSHSALSLRRYRQLGVIWEMVTRTAFTQLRYSWSLLVLCSLVMIIAFVIPVLALIPGPLFAPITGSITLGLMLICYLPTLYYYRLFPAWSLTLPVAGLFYLLMTWSSAYQHLFGEGSQWKNRKYSERALR